MTDTTTASAESAVRPFRIEVPQGEIDELRRRIDATRWPTRELVTDRSQGVQLAAIQNLARYWTTEYDWRRCEARLNALPQFKTQRARLPGPCPTKQDSDCQLGKLDHLLANRLLDLG